MVGAILTQNTNWKNVEKAILALKQKGALRPESIAAMDQANLADTIRAAGYYNQKAERLRAFARFFLEEYGGSVEAMKCEDPAVLREKLLRIRGIGRETADSILAYALGKPVFVVDAYTRRIFARHGWATPGAEYDEIRREVEGSLPADASLLGEFHALLVYIGQHFCRRQARCESCPLVIYPRVEGSGGLRPKAKGR
ncbi:MAG: endonuclease III domain-containing protein [candidate division KSB1 bacterium]|nr:endonuclease III domain-containing protein [candidate division KSB1 bacterium]